MAKCSVCGAETTLFNNGTPICVKCDDNLAQKAKPDKSGVLSESRLYEQMRVTRAEYLRLSEEADYKTRLAQDITPYADGTLAWRQAQAAQHEASEALKRYQQAVQDYSNRASQRRVP